MQKRKRPAGPGQSSVPPKRHHSSHYRPPHLSSPFEDFAAESRNRSHREATGVSSHHRPATRAPHHSSSTAPRPSIFSSSSSRPSVFQPPRALDTGAGQLRNRAAAGHVNRRPPPTSDQRREFPASSFHSPQPTTTTTPKAASPKSVFVLKRSRSKTQSSGLTCTLYPLSSVPSKAQHTHRSALPDSYQHYRLRRLDQGALGYDLPGIGGSHFRSVCEGA